MDNSLDKKRNTIGNIHDVCSHQQVIRKFSMSHVTLTKFFTTNLHFNFVNKSEGDRNVLVVIIF